jgi:prefoldin subunit 5
MEAAIKTLQNSLRQKQEQIASAKNHLETLLSEEGEMIETIQTLKNFVKKKHQHFQNPKILKTGIY